MDLSIVSGTYNRKESLQQMVDSARRSLGAAFGLEYEIVLVDGGSTDGTLEWCREQGDVKLIEQGELLGAVKAFNEGAYAASGQYVVLANDDVTFIDLTLWNAFVFMQEHPTCGMGCFEQDRDGRGWHVNEMPCIINGEQSSKLYGQVCIVPKWLGDMTGWWGDYLHTYGGDNELTANIYELGFQVAKVPSARIHDKEINDELRKRNNIDGGNDPKAVAGHHPDSYAWGHHWRDPETQLTGPRIGVPQLFVDRTELRQRIVYAPVYDPGFAIQKEQKSGLRDALAKRALVVEYDYVDRNQILGPQKMLEEFREVIRTIKPGVVITQLHNSGTINASQIEALRKQAPGAYWVNWNGDYWPENLLPPQEIELAKSFDLQTVINRDVMDSYSDQHVHSMYWQIGWEPQGVGHPAKEFSDVVFLANGYIQARRALVGKLLEIDGISLQLYGAGWGESARENTTYNFVRGCEIYQGAKVAIGDTPDEGASGFVSNRVFQVLAAGGAVLAQQGFRDMESLGLRNGETCVVWENFSDLVEKIRYYLEHDEERIAISRRGQELVFEKHSFECRVDELFGVIDRCSGGWRW